eukprot:symbB.v1.2.031267.t1/scaffold3612.1/size53283/1
MSATWPSDNFLKRRSVSAWGNLAAGNSPPFWASQNRCRYEG